MDNTLIEKERLIDEAAIRYAVEMLVPRYVDRLNRCLNLSQQSNCILESEVVANAPACLRRVELRLVSAKKGYVLMAEPIFWDGEMTKVEPYVSAVCSGFMEDIRDYLQRPDIVDELSRRFVVLAKLSLKAYGFQRWKERWKWRLYQWRVRFVRFFTASR